MNCTKCGSNIPENSMFCPGCGAPVQVAPPQNPVYEQPVQQPVQQQFVQQPMQQQFVQQPMQQQFVQQPMQQPYATAPKKKSKAPWIALGVSLFLLIAIVAIVIILLVSCGDDTHSSPQKLVTNFFQAISENESEDCIDAIYPPMVQMYGKSSYETYTTLRKSILNSLDATTVNISNVVIKETEPMDSEEIQEGNMAMSLSPGYIPMSAGYYVEGSAVVVIDGIEQENLIWEATIVMADGDYYLADFDVDID